MERLDIGVYGARGIPSTYSGYETFLTVLLPGLVARGHDVTMYCRKGSVEPGGSYEGVAKRFLPALDSKSFSTLTHGALSAVAARLARHDVVLVVNVANAAFCGIGHWTGQAVVLNTDGQEWLRGKWGSLARRFFRAAAHISPRVATALIADCVAMRDLYQREFSAPSTVIPYCWTHLAPSEPTALLAQLQLEPGRYFCHAGRLNPENNAVPLAEAYTRASSDWPLVLLGSANYDSPVDRALRALAAADPRIRVIGHVGDRADFAALVRHAGAYFHTHSVGGINPSLIEAMGAGAFVNALATPFNVEALGDGGRYFEGFGPELTAFIEDLPSLGAAEQEDYRNAAAHRARTVFAAADVIDAYEHLLAAAAAAQPRSHVSQPTVWAASRTAG